MSLAVFAFPITFFIVFVPALGYERYIFPSSGVRISWLIAHIAALLAAYAALGFSMLASVLYLVQERRIKSKHKPGEDTWWAPLEWLPPLDTLERIAHATLLFGFPCMTVGLVIGSVLAQETVSGRGLLPRSQGHCLVRDVGSLCPAALLAQHQGTAGPQGRLSLRRRVPGDAGRLGRQPVEPRAQVRCLMTLALIGVNHKTAPIELRERIAISRDDLPEVTRALAGVPGVSECMIVSTCNRVEILAAIESPAVDLFGFPAESQFGLDGAVLKDHLYEHRDQEAVRHLFRVAASLDSMVVGEPQILGQVKEAFAVARTAGTVGAQLEHLLQSAFAAAKRVRSETEIGSNSVSIASVAVDLARKIFGSLNGRTVFLVGAGKMSELAARHLVQQGAGAILVTNRTLARARTMAEEFNGRVIPFEQLYDAASEADIVITSTGAPHAIFRREHGAGLPAQAPQPAHVLHRYRGAARRGPGHEQAGGHLCLRHR